MHLLNIPPDYIPSADQMSVLSDLVDQECTAWSLGATPAYRAALRELQRKLGLLDSVFRAAEELPWEEYMKQQIGKLNKDAFQLHDVGPRGAGGALLQNVDRDTQKFARKASAEEPSWEDYVGQMCGLPKDTYHECVGKPPAPTDENSSFPVGKCPC